MPTLSPRLMRGLFPLALASTILPALVAPAIADPYRAALPADFLNRTVELHGSDTGIAQHVALRFADAVPASIVNGPDQVYLARSTRAFTQSDLQCMSEALYFEARGEGRKGQEAVAEVILNRVDSRAFPSTVCGVVNQTAQFSYTIGGAKRVHNKALYHRIEGVAQDVLSGATDAKTNGATYFHTPAVRPAWSRRFERTVQIGRHIFYRSNQRMASN